MHKREAIRDYIVETLKAECETLDSRVFKGRVYSMDDQALPGATVHILDETSGVVTTMGGLGSRDSERVIKIAITIYVKPVDDVTEVLNDISAEVEIAMAQDIAMSGLAHDNQLTSWQETLNGDEFDKPQAAKTGQGVAVYDVLYTCPENNPTVEVKKDGKINRP